MNLKKIEYMQGIHIFKQFDMHAKLICNFYRYHILFQ